MFFSLYCRHLSTASWWLLVVLCVRAYDRSRLSMTTPYQPRYPTHRGRVSHFDQLAWPNNFLWMLPGRFTCLREAPRRGLEPLIINSRPLSSRNKYILNNLFIIITCFTTVCHTIKLYNTVRQSRPYLMTR